MDEIQVNLTNQNTTMLQENTHTADTRDEFTEKVQEGFVLAHWDGTEETETKIQEKTQATIRCIPADQPEEK